MLFPAVYKCGVQFKAVLRNQFFLNTKSCRVSVYNTRVFFQAINQLFFNFVARFAHDNYCSDENPSGLSLCAQESTANYMLPKKPISRMMRVSITRYESYVEMWNVQTATISLQTCPIEYMCILHHRICLSLYIFISECIPKFPSPLSYKEYLCYCYSTVVCSLKYSTVLDRTS